MTLTNKVSAKLLQLIEELKAEAYQQGWNDAAERILSTARHSLTATTITLNEPRTPPSLAHSQYRVPIIDLVRQIVRDKPGLRGAEIIREVMRRDNSIPPKVADRTGRTSLSRLHRRKEIWQRNSKWYPTSEATAGETKE